MCAAGMDGTLCFQSHRRIYQLNTALSPSGFAALFRQPLPIDQTWHVRGKPFVILSKAPKAHLCWQCDSYIAMLSAPGLPEVSASFPHPHTHPLTVVSHLSLPYPVVGAGILAQESMLLGTQRDTAPGNCPQRLNSKPSPDTGGSAAPPSSFLLEGRGG